jgi:hypothetical protein
MKCATLPIIAVLTKALRGLLWELVNVSIISAFIIIKDLTFADYRASPSTSASSVKKLVGQSRPIISSLRRHEGTTCV